ncbi:hypothetical protein DLJ47_24600 [Micromonospora sp. S4605]|uniref:hypothetical protein n=1 Tax=Micromonospora sp. S4605 TaxID=1420897 RepID=UPI000D6F84C5|nr:hypothetical protein [Micromonospora sp. S4605]PWU50153.1 hypothetical protein DLJ47_24600 [Micromonospora sp. S4605]
MFHRRRASTQPAVEVTELTDEEWRLAGKRGLARLGLTFDQLAEQARKRRFQDVEALKLWQVLGGERP